MMVLAVLLVELAMVQFGLRMGCAWTRGCCRDGVPVITGAAAVALQACRNGAVKVVLNAVLC
jgi:hypothetical protein